MSEAPCKASLRDSGVVKEAQEDLPLRLLREDAEEHLLPFLEDHRGVDEAVESAPPRLHEAVLLQPEDVILQVAGREVEFLGDPSDVRPRVRSDVFVDYASARHARFCSRVNTRRLRPATWTVRFDCGPDAKGVGEPAV